MFPWDKIWYDEPGVSALGVGGVAVGVLLTTASMVRWCKLNRCNPC